jgi:NAD(P)-dependent dehydrogenase (short-subunit alcohol dehydrogenase family)
MTENGDAGQRCAIVTAASQGIGAACARELAGQGYNLILMARSEAIHAIAEEMGAHAVRGDVTQPEDLQLLVDAAMAKHGRIDAVVANTGLSRDQGKYKGLFFDSGDDSSITDYDDEYWYAMFDLLFMNVVRMARLITPIMRAQGGGAFVNISAMISKEPHNSFPSSSTLRRGLDGYVKLYADRHARDGIRMNTVSPGLVANRTWSPSQLDAVPMHSAIETAEVASIVAFLLSEESRYINGQNILADGGLNRSC